MDASWQEVSGRRGYTFYRRINPETHKGEWRAEKDGHIMPITYDQALGYEPIDSTEATAMKLGEILGLGRW